MQYVIRGLAAAALLIIVIFSIQNLEVVDVSFSVLDDEYFQGRTHPWDVRTWNDLGMGSC